MMSTRIVILGAGRWGKNLVRTFLTHPNAQVVAVVDPHPERLAAVSKQFNLNKEVIWVTDWQLLPPSLQFEAVVIATPAVTHYALIADALRQGYHVLAEKPLTLDVNECIELCRLAQAKQRQLIVDHTYLFHPAVKRARAAITAGDIGELRYGYAARTHLGPVRQDVDALWDLAIHDLSIFNTWLGQLPIEVRATGRVWLQPGNSSNPQNSKLPGLADLVQVTLTYPSGFEAYIHLCWLNPDKQRRLCAVGTRGTLIFDEMLESQPLTIQRGYFKRENGAFTPTGQSLDVLEIEPGKPLDWVCDRFLACIRTNQPSKCSSGWVGVELVQILSCLSQSLQQGGQPVRVPSVPNL